MRGGVSRVVLTHATASRKREDILSETRQPQEDKYCMMPLHTVPRDKVGWWFLEVGRMGREDFLLSGYRIPIWEEERFLEMDSGVM